MSEGRERALWFVVVPPGTISTSNDRGRTHLREAARGRGHASIKRALGMDFRALAKLGALGDEAETAAGLRIRVEPMFDASGRVSALLVRGEESAARASYERIASKRARPRGLERLAGSDPAVKTALGLAERFARTSLPILVHAEAGAGAHDLVQGIVAAGHAPEKPLVTVVASSLRTPLSLDPNIGGLAVSGGTLFVDGLEELSLEGQAELLAELDHGVLRDVRLVCSVRTDPPSLVARGVLSRALHHELRAATISLPPLRDRIDRVAVAERMLGDIAPGVAMSAAARAVIERYRFPGNLLELEGALERASALALDDRVLEVEHLPEEMLGLAPDARSEGGLAATAERAVVEEAVKGAGGNMTVAARRLGVARSTLYRMMERHGVLRS